MFQTLDPKQLAQWQLDSDREKTARFAGLAERKIARMVPSPLAFLRGAAPLYYEVLRAHPELAEGPPGEGWLIGDLHLENFGAFQPEPHSFGEIHGKHEHKEDDPRVVFHCNDFDDAIQGPFRFDVLRVVTSLLVGARELGATGRRVLALSDLLLAAYVASLDGGPVPPQPTPVAALTKAAGARSRKELLDARTQLVQGKRRFVRGERYRELAPAIVAQVPAAMEHYLAGLPEDERPKEKAREIVDVAHRIAGTGSLGCLRVAVLLLGKGDDGGLVFDLKEEGDPSASVILGKPTLAPAERVVTAVRACNPHPPRRIGTTTIDGLSMLARQLRPQEDKLDWTALQEKDLEALATYLGAVLGEAHRRGATKPVTEPWSQGDRAGIVERAIRLAALHEAVYLWFCRLSAT